MNEKIKIEVRLNNGENTFLEIYSTTKSNSLFLLSEQEAKEFNEAKYQLLEGNTYEYSCDDGYCLEELDSIVRKSKIMDRIGKINTGLYTGLLKIRMMKINNISVFGEVQIEIRSIKASYREDYRTMLEEITENCVSLIMQENYPVTQNFTQDYSEGSETLYQKFAFVKSIIDTEEFNDAIHKIVLSPVSKWRESEEIVNIDRIKRINSNIIKQFSNSSERINIKDISYSKGTIDSLPRKINDFQLTESIDTVENRFIKFVLVTLRDFAYEIKERISKGREQEEAIQIEEKLDIILQEDLFKDISNINTGIFNSTVLQRKEGYREIYRIWLMFEVASKLNWSGGEDIYSAGKRNIALLYEYWVFFKLLGIIEKIFNIKSKGISDLIEETKSGLGLKLKSGRYIPIKGIFDSNKRKLNIEFSYNKTFTGENSYPSSGSWTKNMRPDYTLSIWPIDFTMEEAESQEIITHIHFDAKYKIEDLKEVFGEKTDDLRLEKEENSIGVYKRGDLLKMHSYKDAIRRTAGAYIIYPGKISYQKEGYHEILPGLGAFPLYPSKNENGSKDIENFIEKVLDHFIDRNSQREKSSFYEYKIHERTNDFKVMENLPEKYDGKRGLPIENIYILIGYIRDSIHKNWIEKNDLYNFRIDKENGSIKLGEKEAGARYLLLHEKNGLITGNLKLITDKGPTIYSKEVMAKLSYDNPKDFYLVYKISNNIPDELKNIKWDIRNLKEYNGNRQSGKPFAVSLSELMNCMVYKKI